LALGIGEGGNGAGPARVTVDAVTGRVPRNAQSLWNIGAREYTTMFHDGRVEMLGDAIPAIRSPAGRDLPEAVSNALVAQAFFPVTSPIEMAGQFGENPIATAAHHEDRSAIWAMLAERIAANPGYFDMLKVAFPKIAAADHVTYQHIAEALAAFQTVAFRSDNSPFDAALRRRDISVLPVAAQRGFRLFYGKAGCSACHSGPLLTDHKFHAIAVPQIGPGKGHGSDMSYLHQTGLPGRAEDEGRYRITNDPTDLFAFRTPSLRNVGLTGPWGHSGAFDRLEDMVRHHIDPRASLAAFDPAKVRLPQLDHLQHLSARGSDLRFAPLEASRRAAFELRDNWVMSNSKLRQRIADANYLAPVSLTTTEITEIVAFLESLTDSSSAGRRDLIPTRVPSGSGNNHPPRNQRKAASELRDKEHRLNRRAPEPNSIPPKHQRRRHSVVRNHTTSSCWNMLVLSSPGKVGFRAIMHIAGEDQMRLIWYQSQLLNGNKLDDATQQYCQS
jgi:cytochrome c peroxidase